MDLHQYKTPQSEARLAVVNTAVAAQTAAAAAAAATPVCAACPKREARL